MIAIITARTSTKRFGKEQEDMVMTEVGLDSCEIKKDDLIFNIIDESKVFAINILSEQELQKFPDYEKEECSSIDCFHIKGAEVKECEVIDVEEKDDMYIIHGKILTTK